MEVEVTCPTSDEAGQTSAKSVHGSRSSSIRLLLVTGLLEEYYATNVSIPVRSHIQLAFPSGTNLEEHVWSKEISKNVLEGHLLVLLRLLSKAFVEYSALYGFIVDEFWFADEFKNPNEECCRVLNDMDFLLMLAEKARNLCTVHPESQAACNFITLTDRLKLLKGYIDEGDNEALEKEGVQPSFSTWFDYLNSDAYVGKECDVQPLFDFACQSKLTFSAVYRIIDKHLDSYTTVDHLRRLIPVLQEYANFMFGYIELKTIRAIFLSTLGNIDEASFWSIKEELSLSVTSANKFLEASVGNYGKKLASADEKTCLLQLFLLCAPWGPVLDEFLLECLKQTYSDDVRSLLEAVVNLPTFLRERICSSESSSHGGSVANLVVVITARCLCTEDWELHRLMTFLRKMVDYGLVNSAWIVNKLLIPAMSSGTALKRRRASMVLLAVFEDSGMPISFLEETPNGIISWRELVCNTLDKYVLPEPALRPEAVHRYNFIKSMLITLDKRAALWEMDACISPVVDHLRNASWGWQYLVYNCFMKETLGRFAAVEVPWGNVTTPSAKELSVMGDLCCIFPDTVGISALDRLVSETSAKFGKEVVVDALAEWLSVRRCQFRVDDLRIHALDEIVAKLLGKTVSKSLRRSRTDATDGKSSFNAIPDTLPPPPPPFDTPKTQTIVTTLPMSSVAGRNDNYGVKMTEIQKFKSRCPKPIVTRSVLGGKDFWISEPWLNREKAMQEKPMRRPLLELRRHRGNPSENISVGNFSISKGMRSRADRKGTRKGDTAFSNPSSRDSSVESHATTFTVASAPAGRESSPVPQEPLPNLKRNDTTFPRRAKLHQMDDHRRSQPMPTPANKESGDLAPGDPVISSNCVERLSRPKKDQDFKRKAETRKKKRRGTSKAGTVCKDSTATSAEPTGSANQKKGEEKQAPTRGSRRYSTTRKAQAK